MAVRRSPQSSRTASTLWLMVALFLVLSVVGGGTTLWAMGFFTAPQSHEGQVAFPSLVRPVKAYERITREDLVDLTTQKIRPIWLPENQAGPGLLRDLSKILGRVAARDKQPGYILTENDFLPIGTRPGVTAGVAPGKRSVSIDVEKVPGLELLRQGDTFDLLAVLPPRTEAHSNVEQASLLGGIKPPDTRSGQLAQQTGVKPLVLRGSMVALTRGSSQSTIGSQSLVVDAQSARRRRETSIMATVAVEPEEVAPLAEALGLEVEMYCVARSGHADDESSDEKPISFEGMVPVVATARSVDAYSALASDDLADSVTGRLNVFYFSPDRIRPEWITDFDLLVGRVVAHGIPQGSILTEEMLLPRGTRPGLVAGAPPGTVILPVPVERMSGLHRLRNGDRFSVYTRLPDELRPAFPQTNWATLQGAVQSIEDQTLQEQLRTGVRIVVKDVILLGEAEPTNTLKDQTEKMVGIAIPEEAVTQLSQLLKDGSELFVAADSGWNKKSRDQDDHRSLGPTAHRHHLQLIDETSIVLASDTKVGAVEKNGDEMDFISVPVTAKPIAAYSKLAIDDFIDPSTGRPRIMLFPRERVDPSWILDLNSLVDRVVTRDIDVGRVIDESKLLPIDSQPGPTAGIPDGMLSLTVNGQQVLGLDALVNLQRGDRFQLVAVRPYDIESLGGTVRRGLTNGDAIQQALATGVLYERAVVDVLCQEVRLVDFGAEVQVVQRNVTNETETVIETQLTADGPIRKENRLTTPQVTERDVATKSYLFALPPEDVSGLAQALAVGTQVLAVPLPGSSVASSPVPQKTSSEAEGSLASTTKQPRPKIIEHIRGTEIMRDVWVTPTPANSVKNSSKKTL